jgi:hypothetical protein
MRKGIFTIAAEARALSTVLSTSAQLNVAYEELLLGLYQNAKKQLHLSLGQQKVHRGNRDIATEGFFGFFKNKQHSEKASSTPADGSAQYDKFKKIDYVQLLSLIEKKLDEVESTTGSSEPYSLTVGLAGVAEPEDVLSTFESYDSFLSNAVIYCKQDVAVMDKKVSLAEKYVDKNKAAEKELLAMHKQISKLFDALEPEKGLVQIGKQEWRDKQGTFEVWAHTARSTKGTSGEPKDTEEVMEIYGEYGYTARFKFIKAPVVKVALRSEQLTSLCKVLRQQCVTLKLLSNNYVEGGKSDQYLKSMQRNDKLYELTDTDDPDGENEVPFYIEYTAMEYHGGKTTAYAESIVLEFVALFKAILG